MCFTGTLASNLAHFLFVDSFAILIRLQYCRTQEESEKKPATCTTRRAQKRSGTLCDLLGEVQPHRRTLFSPNIHSDVLQLPTNLAYTAFVWGYKSAVPQQRKYVKNVSVTITRAATTTCFPEPSLPLLPLLLS